MARNVENDFVLAVADQEGIRNFQIHKLPRKFLHKMMIAFRNIDHEDVLIPRFRNLKTHKMMLIVIFVGKISDQLFK